MAHSTQNPALPFGALSVHRVVSVLNGVRERYEAYQRTRATVAALRGLTPRQLEDVGLTVADVEGYAASGRW
ncbi:MAG: DUF1127 domain-containing protein [Pseudomonadota bacterium]